jgi:hypothetical protein
MEVDHYGDTMANGGEYNRCHNAVNHAVFDAVSAVAVGPVIQYKSLPITYKKTGK